MELQQGDRAGIFAGLNLLVYARIALAPSSLWCYCCTVQARSSAVNFVVFTG